MGAKYSNILVHSITQEQIAQFLNESGYRAYCLPPQKGYVVIYEEECGRMDVEVMSKLLATLTVHFDCFAIGIINFDDDVLLFKIYSGGQLIDEYTDDPESTGHNHQDPLISNHALALAKTFGLPQKQKQIEKILREEISSQSDRHIKLAKALNWPIAYLQMTYIEIAETDDENDDLSISAKSVNRRWIRKLINGDFTPPFDLHKELMKLIRQNRIISAMLLYQQYEKCTLKQAEEYVKRLQK